MRAELGLRGDLLERARMEAEVLARLSHPNIVSVSDFGLTPTGCPYLVMPCLAGRTLAAELQVRKVLPANEAVFLARQLLAGLHAAHVAGVIHRDIKLSNLFLSGGQDGKEPAHLSILDFGIAKLVRAAAVGVAPNQHPTEAGTLVGTPRFIAPEQALGKPLDHRVDIYAAGIVLYTLLAGRSPFQHHVLPHDLLSAHIDEAPEPPSHWLGKHLPAGLDEVVLKALAKEPDQRFADARAFSRALTSGKATPWYAAWHQAPAWRAVGLTFLVSTVAYFLLFEVVFQLVNLSAR